MAVRAIPENDRGPTPYLIVRKAAAAIDFYKKVLGATELMRMEGPDKRIGHAELKIGAGTIMLSDEHPEMGFLSPLALGDKRSPISIHVYVEDVDAVHKRALEAGATSQREPADQFYGDRGAQFTDPFGHIWYIATHKEDVSPAEMEKRFEALSKQQS